MDYCALGKRIRNERLKTGLTQAKLAEMIDVTTAYIGQIERGERKFSIETLVSIALILNVSVDYLLRDSINNSSSALGEFSDLLEERTPDEISLANDILRSVFDHIDKRK